MLQSEPDTYVECSKLQTTEIMNLWCEVLDNFTFPVIEAKFRLPTD